jgi:hypothetical protein
MYLGALFLSVLSGMAASTLSLVAYGQTLFGAVLMTSLTGTCLMLTWILVGVSIDARVEAKAGENLSRPQH